MLKVRSIAIDSYPESIAILSRDCSEYRPEEFQALKKIEVRCNGESILATLIISDERSLVGPDEIGLGEQAFRRLGVPEGTRVKIDQATPPRSLEAVRRKIDGEALTDREIDSVIQDISAHRYSPMEISAFLVASASSTSNGEVLSLTQAMAKCGNRLDWSAPVVVDKHCIGGIPGNRTSMIVVPIVAAHGLPIPKTSSRAITSPAGTADTMEVLANVDVSVQEMQEIVERENGCLIWGGHANLSPADDILISVERPLRIDTPYQTVASILSKKLAAGSTHLVIDIPVGPTAKVRNHNDAIRLRKMFEYVSDKVGLTINVVLTDGSQPIGRGVGPTLEARDVMAVLRNDPDAPGDLRDRALLIAGQILEFDPALRGGAGHARAAEILDSGEALAKMDRIVDRQGRNPVTHAPARFMQDVLADSDGVVSSIDCHLIARIARSAGAPLDKPAGIDLFKKVGDPVARGEPIYRVFACTETNFSFATELVVERNGYAVSSAGLP